MYDGRTRLAREYNPNSFRSRAATDFLIIFLYLYPLLIIGAGVWGLIKAWPLIQQFFTWLG